MAEGNRKGSLSPVSELDVKRYYAEGRKLSSAVCTAKETSRFGGENGEIMRQLHPEVLRRYYGCGLVAPDELLGLDVLDLGCGVGVDCFMLSKFVGPAGHVIGVDMTSEQLAIANKYREYHSKKWGYERPNTMFLKGYIEDLKPAGIPDASQDLVVSNCVISLSLKKDAVLQEAARVLRPGGEFYFSDMYSNKPVPTELKKDKVLWGEGFGGALQWSELVRLANDVGFCPPVLYESEELKYRDNEVLQRIPDDLKYKAVTYRMFRLPHYPVNKACRLVMTYRGGIMNGTSQFWLTSEIHVEEGESVIVSRELGECLKLSRYGKYLSFEVHKENDTNTYTDRNRRVILSGGTCHTVSRLARRDGDPLGLDGDPPGLDGDPLGLDGDPLGLDGDPIGLDGDPLGLDGDPLGLDGDPLGLDGDPLGLDGDPLGLDGDPLGLDGDPLGLDGDPIGLDGDPLGLDGDPLGLDGDPLGLDGDPLGLDGDPLGLDGDPLGLDGDPLGLDGDPLGLDGDPLGEGMDPGMGLPGMMEGFPRHYGFPGQAGYPPWPMMPSIPVPQPDFLHLQPKAEDFSTNQRPPNSAQNHTRRSKSSAMDGAPVSPPPSRERFSYTRYQLELLNTIYTRIRYPNSMQKQLIAKRVGIKRDQVKVWFQNRRRKDITGKRSKSDEITRGPQQVPHDILDSVLQELLKYENDPKGKKVVDSQKEYEKKVSARKRCSEALDDETPVSAKRQRHESATSSVSSHSSNSNKSLPTMHHDLPEIYFASEPSPQGSATSEGSQIVSISRLSPNSRSAESTSFSSDHSSYQISSVDSCPETPYSTDGSTGSVTSPQPLTIVPSAQELDMNAPPNAVALPLEKATLERPRSLESPALEPHVDDTASPDTTDDGLGIPPPDTEKNLNTSTDNSPPPNTVAPPSEKINFDAAQLAKKAKILSVNIPLQNKNNQDRNPLFPNSNTADFSQSENLTTPNPVQLFNSPAFSQWNQNPGNLDKITLQEQLYNTVLSQAETGSIYPESLSSHYDKLYAPYMVGFYPDQSNFMGQGQQPTMPPFMLPNLNYPLPFGSYDSPSDLSLKKQYENA